MDRARFEKLVEEGIREVPEKFLALLNNVAIIIEEEPSGELKRRLRLGKGYTLLGLYEGIPQTARERYGEGATMPDRITIFRRPILEAADGNQDKVREIVCDTVRHEIAHHFGMDERRVRRSEAGRRRKHR